MRRYTPLLLTIAGFAVLGTLAVYRFLETTPGAHRLITLAGMLLYVAWMLWESRVSVAEVSRSSQDHDRGTMEQCAAVKLTLLTTAMAFPAIQAPIWVGAFALPVIAVGIWLRTSAISALGTTYSHRIRTPALPLVTSGPYALMRHPAYAGTLLIHSAVVAQFPNPISLASLAAWFVAVWWRTKVEDQFLQSLPAYRDYARDVPGLWLPGRATGQSVLPLVFSTLFVLAIAGLFVRQQATLAPPMTLALGAMVGLYLIWLLVEAATARKELDLQRTSIDRGTMEFYAAGRALTVLAGLAVPVRWQDPGPWYWLGVGLFLAGVVFRITAIRTLGRFYSHRVRLQDSHQIVSSGPYRFLRHPAYTGMIVAHAGFVVCFLNPLSLAMLFLVLIPAVILRIRVEEKALFSLDGYALYAQSRRRLIPLVW